MTSNRKHGTWAFGLFGTSETRWLIAGAASLALGGCAVGEVGRGSARDALHADLGVCATEAREGGVCDPRLDAASDRCASADDFSVACRCEPSADGTTGRLRCAPGPAPVPPITLCSADLAPGSSCAPDDAATLDVCFLPGGGRCVCRAASDGSRDRAGYVWTCEVPPPPPASCDRDIAPGTSCDPSSTASRCELADGTSCYCATASVDGDRPADGSSDLAAGRWVCERHEPPAVPFCFGPSVPPVMDTSCDLSVPVCALDDGTACRCIDDGSRTSEPREDGTEARRGRLECERPAPAPVSYCPDSLGAADARIECREIGATCAIASSTGGRCACVEDSMRDPSFPVGFWSCEVPVTDPGASGEPRADGSGV